VGLYLTTVVILRDQAEECLLASDELYSCLDKHPKAEFETRIEQDGDRVSGFSPDNVSSAWKIQLQLGRYEPHMEQTLDNFLTSLMVKSLLNLPSKDCPAPFLSHKPTLSLAATSCTSPLGLIEKDPWFLQMASECNTFPKKMIMVNLQMAG